MSKRETTMMSVRDLKACAKVAAKSKQDSLKVVHVEKRGGEVVVEACDNYTLVRFARKAEDYEGGDFEALFRADQIAALKTSKVDAYVDRGDGAMNLMTPDGVTIPASEGRFPDLRAVLKDARDFLADGAPVGIDPARLKELMAAFCASSMAHANFAMRCMGERRPVRFVCKEDGKRFDGIVMPVRNVKACESIASRVERPEGEPAKPAEVREESSAAEVREEEKPEPAKPAEVREPEPAEGKPEGDAEDRGGEDSRVGEIERRAAELGLAVKVTSLNVWVSGDTKPHREELKKAGLKWSAKRCAWYWRIPQAA